jgi:phosphopantothenoylcysteine synthetase/decarboxylase
MGIRVHVIAAAAEKIPACFTSMTRCVTNDEMEKAASKLLAARTDAPSAVVHAAAVLDFAPAKKLAGKTPSHSGNLNIELTPTPKILQSFKNSLLAKVAFKLEISADQAAATKIARKYTVDHQLTMMVVNNLSDVGPDRHIAQVFECPSPGQPVDRPFTCDSKEELARTVARHVMERLSR